MNSIIQNTKSRIKFYGHYKKSSWINIVKNIKYSFKNIKAEQLCISMAFADIKY